MIAWMLCVIGLVALVLHLSAVFTVLVAMMKERKGSLNYNLLVLQGSCSALFFIAAIAAKICGLP